jgi:ParB-like nuclease domain
MAKPPAAPDLTGLRPTIRTAKLADYRLLEVNARWMKHETFHALVENVKADGCLTSVPLALLDADGGYTIVSGNHRVRAAIEAGVEEAQVMHIDELLPHDRRLALQLSHNAIEGEDDPAILKQLYESIDDISWRDYAGLDDKTLDLLEQVTLGSLGEANLDFETLTITFLPGEMDEAARVFAKARDLATGSTWLADLADCERTFAALANGADSADVTNQAVALKVLLDLAEAHFEDLADRWWDAKAQELRAGRKPMRYVPLVTMLGSDRVPPQVAAVVKRAVDKMQSRGEITHGWQALEFLCADYLAGGN